MTSIHVTQGLALPRPGRGRKRKHSDETKEKIRAAAKRGSDNPSWKGGYTNESGYTVVCIDGKQRLEHRAVMEKHLGRPLEPGENVHHINGVRGDNRIENLELWCRPQPSGVRVSDVKHCPTCTCNKHL